jgi:hypothetical protein
MLYKNQYCSWHKLDLKMLTSLSRTRSGLSIYHIPVRCICSRTVLASSDFFSVSPSDHRPVKKKKKKKKKKKMITSRWITRTRTTFTTYISSSGAWKRHDTIWAHRARGSNRRRPFGQKDLLLARWISVYWRRYICPTRLRAYTWELKKAIHTFVGSTKYLASQLVSSKFVLILSLVEWRVDAGGQILDEFSPRCPVTCSYSRWVSWEKKKIKIIISGMTMSICDYIWNPDIKKW